MPTRRSRSATNTPSSPKPPFSVRSSCACVGLTVIDEIREHEPALEQVHASPPLELPVVVERDGQADVRHRRLGEVPLIAGVVHGQHGADPFVVRMRGELGLEIDARERRLPVVRVDDARRLRAARAATRPDGAREERVASRVVGIVAQVVAVETGPVEVQLALDEDDARIARLVRRRGLVEARRLGARTHR